MSFNSIHFFIFFPIVILIYFIVPQKLRWIWLLFSNYYFYVAVNPRFIIILIFLTTATYLIGLFINKCNSINNKKKAIQLKKLYLTLGCIACLGILFLFKYYNFSLSILIKLGELCKITVNPPAFDVFLPLGISFYTLQALSYLIEVYRGDISCEKNIGKYALFLSFFPTILSGPIEKSKNLLYQFNETHFFDYCRIRRGLILMLWGYFKKNIIADRLAILVNTVYSSPNDYFGFQIVIASIFFAFQIYADFSAYSDIAIGLAEIMGYNLTTNFRQPYFSKSIKEFWKRWHITLGAWLKDYLYVPLGGNRKGKIRTYINIIIVFLVSGLWHGPSMTFILWGLLHGIYQVIGDFLIPIKTHIIKKARIKTDVFSYKLGQIIITFILVDFAWMFFRANSFSDIKILLKHMLVFNPWVLLDGSLYSLGLNSMDFLFSLIGIVLLIGINALETKTDLINSFTTQNLSFRWIIYITAILMIIILGVFGPQYDEQQFIYSQF